MSNMIDYLLDLAADPDDCARFKASPESELIHADLSDWEKAALISRDPLKISAAMTAPTADTRRVLEWLLSEFDKPDD